MSVIIKLGGVNRLIRLKSGTAELLNLKATTKLVKGKGGRIKRGVKGTKSYTLFLRNRTVVGGAEVVSVDIPVPGGVKVEHMYNWGQNQPALAGLRTPWGIAYSWADRETNGATGLLGQAANIAETIIDGVNFIENRITDADSIASRLGNLGAAANAVREGNFLEAGAEVVDAVF
ncbi:MAG: hypothetical protein AAFR24_06660 [Cyanobacteria bacterium J06627_3]